MKVKKVHKNLGPKVKSIYLLINNELIQIVNKEYKSEFHRGEII